MKHLSKLILLAMLVIFASCEKEKVDEPITEQQAELRFKDGKVISDGEEDTELTFNKDSEKLATELVTVAMRNNTTNAPVLETYVVVDADRSPNSNDGQPVSNMWWSITGTDYDSPASYFSTPEGDNLIFTEYTDGTASLVGTTVSGTCVVELDVWFKDKKTWTEWQAVGGEHRKEGTAGSASNSEDMNFYVIDSSKSTLTASGGDCDMTGTFGLAQVPDGPSTPKYGVHVGPGGANYDSNIGALGLSSWGMITDLNTGEHLYRLDFNFRIEAAPQGCEDCLGKVTDLTLKWKWFSNYKVKVYQRYENTLYATKIFDQRVGYGDHINLSGSNSNGTIGKWAYVYVNGFYYTKFRTDCDINIGPGYKRGVLEVVSGESSLGGELCEYQPPYSWCWWW